MIYQREVLISASRFDDQRVHEEAVTEFTEYEHSMRKEEERFDEARDGFLTALHDLRTRVDSGERLTDTEITMALKVNGKSVGMSSSEISRAERNMASIRKRIEAASSPSDLTYWLEGLDTDTVSDRAIADAGFSVGIGRMIGRWRRHGEGQ